MNDLAGESDRKTSDKVVGSLQPWKVKDGGICKQHDAHDILYLTHPCQLKETSHTFSRVSLTLFKSLISS